MRLCHRFDPGDVASVAARVRAELETDIVKARREFLEPVEPGELDADPARARVALAFAAQQAVQQSARKYRQCALTMPGRTPEAE